MKKKLKHLIRTIFRYIVKAEPASYLLKQYIIRKYLILNKASMQNNATKTPWVCEFPYDPDHCIAYINAVFSDYFLNSGLSINNIVGKKILEIGPGETLGVALRFIAAGAEKVVCVDRFNSLIDDKKQTEIYKKLVALLPKNEQERLKNVLSFNIDKTTINAEYIQYLNISAEKLDSVFPPNHFDYIISRAVLEHIFLIEPAMEVMDLLLKQGGYMLHEIDFRDHGIFTNYMLPPLTFLSVDAKIWHSMTSNLGAPNRKMLGYYKSFFTQKGYLCNTFILRLFYSDNISRKLKSVPENTIDPLKIRTALKKIHPSCKIAGNEDLMVAAAFYCAQKCFF